MIAARVVRILAWMVVFIVPLLSMGHPLPYGVFVLVPLLAAIDGVTFRRALIWVILTLLFVFVYRVPIGTLSAPLVLVMLVHVAAQRGVQLGGSASRLSQGARQGIQAVLWSVGFVLFSALASLLFYGVPLSGTQVFSLWYQLGTGGILVISGVLAFVLFNRFSYRLPDYRAW